MTDPVMSAAEIDAFNLTCPFNAWLGVRVVAASAAGVEIEAPWRDEFVGSPNLRTIHGGVLAALVETTAGLSLFAALGTAGPAIDLRVDYHRPVRSGPLRGRGRVLRAGGRSRASKRLCTMPTISWSRAGVPCSWCRGRPQADARVGLSTCFLHKRPITRLRLVPGLRHRAFLGQIAESCVEGTRRQPVRPLSTRCCRSAPRPIKSLPNPGPSHPSVSCRCGETDRMPDPSCACQCWKGR